MFKFEPHPLTISGILKSGWELYKYVFHVVWIWSLIVSIIYIIPPLFGFIGFYHVDDLQHIHFSWVGLLLFISLLFVWTFFITVLFHAIYLMAIDHKTNFKESLKVASNKLLSLYSAMLIYYFAVLVGVAFFLFPGVLIWVLFAMFLPLIVLENQSIYNAFDGSARLVWGNWWQTFIVLIIPALISYAVRNLAQLTTVENYWTLGLDVIIMTIIMPYFYTVLLVQYHNLKLKQQIPQATEQVPRPQS